MLGASDRIQQRQATVGNRNRDVKTKAMSLATQFIATYKADVLKATEDKKPTCKIEVLQPSGDKSLRVLGSLAINGSFTLSEYIGDEGISGHKNRWRVVSAHSGWHIPDLKASTGINSRLNSAVISDDGRVWFKPLQGIPGSDGVEVFGVNNDMLSPETSLTNLARLKPVEFICIMEDPESKKPAIIQAMQEILQTLQTVQA